MAEQKDISAKVYRHILRVSRNKRVKCHVGKGMMSRDHRRRCSRCNEPLPCGCMDSMCDRCREDIG